MENHELTFDLNKQISANKVTRSNENRTKTEDRVETKSGF